MTPHLGVPFIVLCYEVLKNSILLIMVKLAQQTLVTVDIPVFLSNMLPDFAFLIIYFLTTWFFITCPFSIWQPLFRLMILINMCIKSITIA